MTTAFDSTPDDDLPKVATRFLEVYPQALEIRNKVQDILWQDSKMPSIPKKHRRAIARAILPDQIYGNFEAFVNLLDRLWILGGGWLGKYSTGRLQISDNSLRAQIIRHVGQYRGDWETETLFTQIGAFEASDTRFGLFIEGLSSPDVLTDENAQRSFVHIFNRVLVGCGAELREVDSKDGYPVFKLASLYGATAGRPKNLIFASRVKPDLRFRDAINNDIEIVTNAEKVLIYDRPIGDEGVRWFDLQDWWAESNKIDQPDIAKSTLYRRLKASLPENSPPQTLLFESYFRQYGAAIPNLPALLPEVWLHWDPRTVKQRGCDALVRFRMDFLLLLPHGVRIVLEVDGKQHYSNANGMADTERYAEMVAADRDLKLAGYHVFRFGAAELIGESASIVAKRFYERLFKYFKVNMPPARKSLA